MESMALRLEKRRVDAGFDDGVLGKPVSNHHRGADSQHQVVGCAAQKQSVENEQGRDGESKKNSSEQESAS